MANVVNGNPLILDTAVANWAALSLPLPRMDVLQVYSVQWFNPTTAGHVFSIQQSDSRVILEGRAEANNGSQKWDFRKPLLLRKIDGWFLQAIGSGKLYLWFR